MTTTTPDLRGILVNPTSRTITEVRRTFGDYKTIIAALNEGATKPVDLLTAVSFGAEIVGYLDDEGLLLPDNPVFFIGGNPTPLAGNLLLLGTDGEGNERDLPSHVDVLTTTGIVQWSNQVSTGDFGPSRNTLTDHPILGKDIPTLIGGSAILKDKA